MSLASISNINLVVRVNPENHNRVTRKFVRYDGEYIDGSIVRCSRILDVCAKSNERMVPPIGEVEIVETWPDDNKNEIENWIVEQEITYGREILKLIVPGSLRRIEVLQDARPLNPSELTGKKLEAEKLKTALFIRQLVRVEEKVKTDSKKTTQLVTKTAQLVTKNAQLVAKNVQMRKQISKLNKKIENLPEPHRCNHPSPAPEHNDGKGGGW
jgi:regulator of replication initiation timing